VLGVRCWLLDTGCRALCVFYRVLCVGCRVLGVCCWVLGVLGTEQVLQGLCNVKCRYRCRLIAIKLPLLGYSTKSSLVKNANPIELSSF